MRRVQLGTQQKPMEETKLAGKKADKENEDQEQIAVSVED